MNMFLRIVFLLKVMVLLSLGSTAAWAECVEHEKHAWSGQVTQGELMLATGSQEAGDQDKDDSSIDDPGTDDGGMDEGDEGDSQT
jgi:hypothetical protein